jgi:hypothetical protein
MNSVFVRLRWSVFEGISTIRVAPEEEDSGAELKPFIGHPLAAGAATEVPLHEMSFTIITLDELEGGDDEDQESEAPDPNKMATSSLLKTSWNSFPPSSMLINETFLKSKHRS